MLTYITTFSKKKKKNLYYLIYFDIYNLDP